MKFKLKTIHPGFILPISFLSFFVFLFLHFKIPFSEQLPISLILINWAVFHLTFSFLYFKRHLYIHAVLFFVIPLVVIIWVLLNTYLPRPCPPDMFCSLQNL